MNRVVNLADIPHLPDALCARADPEEWWPPPGGSETGAYAKAICRDCPEQTACLQWALDHHERGGIWGGYNDAERKRLAKTEAAGRCRDCPAAIPQGAVLCRSCRPKARAATRQASEQRRRAA